MQKNIISSVLEDIGRRLGEARARKALSQRALAERVGTTQAHVSKIEQGQVDVRLSTLVELARALDLDFQLVPRRALHAVKNIVRSAERETQDASESRALSTLAKGADAVAAIRSTYPDLVAARKLSETVSNLNTGGLDPKTLKALERAIAPATQLSTKLAAGLDNQQLTRLLEKANRSLSILRNAQLHAAGLPDDRVAGRPAYRLEEADDD